MKNTKQQERMCSLCSYRSLYMFPMFLVLVSYVLPFCFIWVSLFLGMLCSTFTCFLTCSDSSDLSSFNIMRLKHRIYLNGGPLHGQADRTRRIEGGRSRACPKDLFLSHSRMTHSAMPILNHSDTSASKEASGFQEGSEIGENPL